MSRRKKSYNKLVKITKELEKFEDLVSVVYFDSTMKSSHNGNASAADVAEINYRGGESSDGTPKPPARPFMDISFAIAEQNFLNILLRGIKDVSKGRKTAGQALRAIGVEQKRALRKVLDNGLAYGLQPNAESWAARKGADTPMKETGNFLSKSVRTKVRKRSG